MLTFDHKLKFRAPFGRNIELHRFLVLNGLIHEHCLNCGWHFGVLISLLLRRLRREGFAFIDSKS